jgi:hypothetical protein
MPPLTTVCSVASGIAQILCIDMVPLLFENAPVQASAKNETAAFARAEVCGNYRSNARIDGAQKLSFFYVTPRV